MRDIYYLDTLKKMKKRNILITGGSAGMGLSSAIKFAEKGDLEKICRNTQNHLFPQ